MSRFSYEKNRSSYAFTFLKKAVLLLTLFICSCPEGDSRTLIENDAAFDIQPWQWPDYNNVFSQDALSKDESSCKTANVVQWSDKLVKIKGSTAKENNAFGNTIKCGGKKGMVGPQRYYRIPFEIGKSYHIKLTANFTSALYLFSECSQTIINIDCGSAGVTGFFSSTILPDETYSTYFVAPASGTYLIAIDSFDASEKGDFLLEVEELEEPTNERCENAKSLIFSPQETVEVSDITWGAKNEFSDQISCKTGAILNGPQLYYSLELTAQKWYRISLKPTFKAALYLFAEGADCKPANIDADCAGLTGTTLPSVAPNSTGETAFFPTTTGRYLIAVDGIGSNARGTFSLSIASFEPKPGMTCKNPESIKLTDGMAKISGSTVSMVNESGVFITCDSGYPFIAPQVYYSAFLQAKPYQVVLQPTFAAVLAIGQSCTTLPADCQSGGSTGDSRFFAANSVGSLSFTPKTSGFYILVIDGTSHSAVGDFKLELKEDEKPQNGTCESPKVLTQPITESGNTGKYKNDLTGIQCGSPLPAWEGPQAYFRVALKAGVSYSITLQPEPSFDPALYVFPAKTACSSQSINIACQGLFSDSQGAGKTEAIKLKPSMDEDFIVVVDSWSPSEVGQFSLKIE